MCSFPRSPTCNVLALHCPSKTSNNHWEPNKGDRFPPGAGINVWEQINFTCGWFITIDFLSWHTDCSFPKKSLHCKESDNNNLDVENPDVCAPLICNGLSLYCTNHQRKRIWGAWGPSFFYCSFQRLLPVSIPEAAILITQHLGIGEVSMAETPFQSQMQVYSFGEMRSEVKAHLCSTVPK